MTDLLGPGAWGAARAVTTRPGVVPANAGGDPDTFAKDCTNPLAADGTENRAAHMNALLAQMRGAIRRGGVAENNADDDMLARAIRAQRANFVAAASVAGTANAITLAFSPTFTALADLVGVPLVFLAEAANTLAVTVAVDGTAATAVTWPDGTALAAGDIANGALLTVRYDGTAFRMQQCLSPTQVRFLALKRTRTVISATGAYTFTNPFSYPILALIKAWGAGGGGGGAVNPAGAAGGGGGGYFELPILIPAGAGAVTGSVGIGGAAGLAGGANGGAGGNTTVIVSGVTYTALGGNGGASVAAATVGNSAAGGAITGAVDILANGSPSDGGLPLYGGGTTVLYRGGNGGASGRNGGLGGQGGTGAPNAGQVPGGGGGGGGANGGNVNGAAGARGEVWIEI